jgi:glycosyltransferase involved in cell wall biosynthesis
LFDNLARRFGYVGSIVPHKGVHHLIEAFSTMPAHAILDIYGSLRDSPDYVRDLRARCHHPGIHFAGELRPEEVPAAMASFDCLIAPSIWQENAPLGVQEAFAAGTPVVASDLGGHRELFEEGGGLLIPPGDHSALSTVLTRLATEPGLIGQIASGVRPPRTMEQHLAELRSLYSAVLERVDHPVRSSTP